VSPPSRRVTPGVARGPAFTLTHDGQPVEAYPGESIATALLAAGRRLARLTAHRGAPRGVFCAIGVCHDCRMVVDGQPNVRTCLEPARPGQAVLTQPGFGFPPAPDPRGPGP
jgi:hypothetical protein